jgi:hypothetical protein
MWTAYNERQAGSTVFSRIWHAQRGKDFWPREAGSPVFAGILRAQREEKFDNAKLDHTFSLVSGTHSVEKILLLQPWRAQRRENI